MGQSFTFQNAPVELLDVPQLVLLTDTTQKVDTWLMDRFFPQRVSYTKKEIVVVEENRPLTTSLHIADGSKANHKAVMQLIKTHIHHFNKFGRVAFEMRPFETSGGAQLRRIALLNEQQATFLMTLMRNTERVVEFKCALVKAFFETREFIRSQDLSYNKIHSKLCLQLDLEKADASLAGHILGSYRKKRDILVTALTEVEQLMQPCLFE